MPSERIVVSNRPAVHRSSGGPYYWTPANRLRATSARCIKDSGRDSLGLGSYFQPQSIQSTPVEVAAYSDCFLISVTGAPQRISQLKDRSCCHPS